MNTEKSTQGFSMSPAVRTGLKIVILVVLVLVLLIPLHMVRAVVRERERRQAQTVEEIVRLQGGRQELVGPLVAIPATEGYVDGEGIERSRVRDVVIALEGIDAAVTLSPELLSRGIYEVPVYDADVRIDGSVALPSTDEVTFAGVDVQRIHWDEAVLVLGIGGVSGLRTTPTVTVDGVVSEVSSAGNGFSWIRAGSGDQSVSRAYPGGAIDAGFTVPLRGARPETRHEVSFSFTLSGGERFHMVPTAMHSSLSMDSSWESPSFTGDLLPTERTVSEDGFTARWDMTALGMGMPRVWIGESSSPRWLERSRVGVRLFQPLDHYQQTTRSVKYGVLFILFPFVALFLLEILTGTRIHPVQYLCIAAAKIVFYLVVLSLSEHIAFLSAYWIGAAATIVLVTFYTAAFLSRRGYAFLLGGMIAAEYVFLFSVLRSEDYALLIGSLGLFALLAAVMAATRRVNWYRGGALNSQDSDHTL